MYLSGSPAHVAKLSDLTSAVSRGQYHVAAAAVSAGIIQDRLAASGVGLG